MSDTKQSDQDLLEAWRDGDEAAGRALFDRHFASVFRFFRNKIGDAAEDLTQQTFMGCVKSIENFRGDASFRTYLFTIARKRLYTHLRTRYRKPTPDALGERSIVELGVPSPSQIIAGRQEQKLLLEGLRRLPVDMQIAVELFYWEELTVFEIAEIIETPVGTVKSRLQRARAKLETIIEELTDSPDLAQSTIGGFERWAKELRGKMS